MRTRATVNLGGALLIRALSPRISRATLAAMIAEALGEPAPKGAVEQIPDLDEAIEQLTEAIRAKPPGGPVAYSQLGGALRKRYAMTGRGADLRRALRTMRTAVATCPPDAPAASIALYHLAGMLTDQWEMTGAPAPRDEALARYREAAQVETASADWRVTVGQRWGEFAMEAGPAEEAVRGFATAVAALDEAAWRGLGRADQERVLRTTRGWPATRRRPRSGRPTRAPRWNCWSRVEASCSPRSSTTAALATSCTPPRPNWPTGSPRCRTPSTPPSAWTWPTRRRTVRRPRLRP